MTFIFLGLEGLSAVIIMKYGRWVILYLTTRLDNPINLPTVQWRHIVILNEEWSATAFLSTILHGVTPQTTVIFRVTTVKNAV
jgi:hypothetical protein